MIKVTTTKTDEKKFANVEIKGTGLEILNEVHAIICGILEEETIPREKFLDMLLDTLLEDLLKGIKKKHSPCDGDCKNCELNSEDDDEDQEEEDSEEEEEDDEECCENCKYEDVPANKLPCRNCTLRVSASNCFEEKK